MSLESNLNSKSPELSSNQRRPNFAQRVHLLVVLLLGSLTITLGLVWVSKANAQVPTQATNPKASGATDGYLAQLPTESTHLNRLAFVGRNQRLTSILEASANTSLSPLTGSTVLGPTVLGPTVLGPTVLGRTGLGRTGLGETGLSETGLHPGSKLTAQPAARIAHANAIANPQFLATVRSMGSTAEPVVEPEANPAWDNLDGEAVRKSIRRALRFLIAQRNNEDHWVEHGGQPGGLTALAALAMLSSGVDANSPELLQTLRYLAAKQPERTYSSALITMALTAADPVLYRPQIQMHVDYLVKIQDPGGGGFGYGNRGGNGDSSNTQFALLALHEAQVAGIDIDKEVWRSAKNYWTKVFSRRSGAFNYTVNNSTPTGSMTCAGICSMIMIDENLAEGAAVVAGNQVKCCQGTPPNPMIDEAIGWLTRNFSVKRNPASLGDSHASILFYYLYSLERTGRLSGRRFFGNHDWYREGASHLLSVQRPDGGWRGTNFGDENPVVATSMALLFLSKGLRPVLMAKYRHGEADNWDPHPKGVHYLTRFVENTWSRKLNWQTIEADNATPDDLLETPVLYITGDRRLNLTFQQIKNLKEYIDNGGFLYIESENGFSCPDAKLFDQDVRELLAALLPDSKLEVLKPEHLVWSSQFALVPNQDFPVLGIQSCCRTSVIYTPSPMSGFWQLKKPSLKEQSDAVQEKVNYATKLGTNILAFATGNELKDKLDRPKLDGEKNDQSDLVGRRILIPKLKHGAGYDDAPMALGNLLRRVGADRGVQFQSRSEFVDSDLKSLVSFPIVFVHGRGKFSLNPDERTAVQQHLERGGYIFGDAICGDQVFYDSFKEEMQLVLKTSNWQEIPPEDAIFTPRYGGYALDQVQLRVPRNGATKTISSTPKLEALDVDGRHQVIFSRYDISCALENGTTSSCYGYTVDDAAKIGANILLYALSP